MTNNFIAVRGPVEEKKLRGAVQSVLRKVYCV